MSEQYTAYLYIQLYILSKVFASLLNILNLLEHFRLGNMIICHLVLLFCLHNHQVQLFAQLVKICENQMTEKEVREKVATTTSAS